MMARFWIIILMLLCGCGDQVVRMAHPEDPDGPYHDQIAAAKRLLVQKEDWADRVEWEVIKTDDGWRVNAWRIEHPQNKGPDRYVPWGYATIELDSRLVAIHYHHHG